tara:strand:+ start:716 stop:916 length:201 start_codon:yes stop_codon:yes gene_type:complete
MIEIELIVRPQSHMSPSTSTSTSRMHSITSIEQRTLAMSSSVIASTAHSAIPRLVTVSWTMTSYCS